MAHFTHPPTTTPEHKSRRHPTREATWQQEFYYVWLNVVIVYHFTIARAINRILIAMRMENSMFGRGTRGQLSNWIGGWWRLEFKYVRVESSFAYKRVHGEKWGNQNHVSLRHRSVENSDEVELRWESCELRCINQQTRNEKKMWKGVGNSVWRDSRVFSWRWRCLLNFHGVC